MQTVLRSQIVGGQIIRRRLRGPIAASEVGARGFLHAYLPSDEAGDTVTIGTFSQPLCLAPSAQRPTISSR